MSLTPSRCPHAPPYGPSTPTRHSLHISRLVGGLTGFYEGQRVKINPKLSQNHHLSPMCTFCAGEIETPLGKWVKVVHLCSNFQDFEY